MALSPGTRLGPYEIVAPAGAGGMGEVYRGRDTRLDRTVAIKILPAALAVDPQLRDRFEREARAISSLNHPHICALFDIGRESDVDFLVLEYLDGQTLAERLTAGPLPVADALKIATQVCDALDRAHRSGIVHRDLKPANIMLTKSGAKLLDFGLAKSAAPVVSTTGLSMLPTTPPNLTVQGTILGTFQYMAPEQIEGLEADARTDIFAFGALLFEMLTGRTAFEGKTRASLLGAILKDDPPRISTVQALAPSSLDRIVSTCLQKDPDDRYQSARDLLRDLKWVASGSSESAPARPTAAARSSSRLAWSVAGMLALALVVVAALVLRGRGGETPTAEPAQFTIAPPENIRFGGPPAGGTGTATQLAVSPDGRYVVFVGGRQGAFQLWLRTLGTLAMTPIPGTEDAAFPFWSPDSRFIGFFASAKLKKVQVGGGGPPSVLCDVALRGTGGTWNRDNVIVFAAVNGGLMRVSGAGGTPTSITALDPATGETSHRWPFFLPDGRHFLYTASTGVCCPPVKPAAIRVASLDSADAATLFQGVESAVSYAAGHLLFVRGDDTLMAQAFDLRTNRTQGEAFPLAEHVGSEGTRYASVSVSRTGVLAYGSGSRGTQRLTWFDRAGRTLGTVDDASPFESLTLSPDERHAAVQLASGSPPNRDIFVIDIGHGTRSRLTFDPGLDGSPVWSPDGSHIAFQGTRSGKVHLRQKRVGGTADDEPLIEAAAAAFPGAAPTSWSADGRFIAYTQGSGAQTDVWILPLFGDRKPFPVAQSSFTETSGTFSPDGRWIAYSSNEAGPPDIYVQPFPPNGNRYKVSKDGATHPVWRADGRELFFLAVGSGMLMATPIGTTAQWDAGVPEPLFLAGTATVNPSQQYAATKDGKRFLINTRAQQSGTEPLTVVLNWPATVQK
jgi:Tol biopolymer transport system component